MRYRKEQEREGVQEYMYILVKTKIKARPIKCEFMVSSNNPVLKHHYDERR